MAQKWKCRVCSFIEINEQAPHRCPICKAESEKFVMVPYVPEAERSRVPLQVQVETSDESPLPVLVASTLEINSLDEPFEGEKLCGLTISIEPGQEAEQILLDREAILLVISGEGEITSDMIKIITNQEQLDFEEMTIEESLDLFSNIPTEKPQDSSGNKTEPEIKREQITDEPTSAPSDDMESTHDIPLVNATQILQHDAIMLPSNKRIRIENKGDSPLIIFVAY